MKAGVVVWIVDYVARQVEVHYPGEPVLVLGDVDKISGGTILADLELLVADFFPKDDERQTVVTFRHCDGRGMPRPYRSWQFHHK